MMVYLIPFITLVMTISTEDQLMPECNYSLYKIIPNPYKFKRFALAPDYSMILLYQRGYQYPPSLYDPYSWQPLLLELTLHNNPYYVTFLPQLGNNYRIIYSNKESQVRVIQITTNGKAKQTLLYVNTAHCQFEKIAVSSDGLHWASFCDLKCLLYIGSTMDPEEEVIEISYEECTHVIDLTWRPVSQQLLVSVSNRQGQLNPPPFIFNLQDNSTTPLNINITLITSLSFASSELVYMVDQQGEEKPSLVKLYNMTAENAQTYEMTQVVDQLAVEDGFLAVLKKSDVFQVYERKSFTDDARAIFTAGAIFWQNIEGNDGNYLLRYKSKKQEKQSQIEVYRLCNQPGFYYSSLYHSCEICNHPCAECLLSANQCASCVSLEYAISTRRECVSCASLIAHCRTCTSNHNCLTCQAPFLPYQGLCMPCSQLIEGCMSCQSAQLCLSCQEDFQLNSQRDKCEEKGGHKAVIIVAALIGVTLLVLILLIARKKIEKQRRAREVESFLQKEGQDQLMEGVDGMHYR